LRILLIRNGSVYRCLILYNRIEILYIDWRGEVGHVYRFMVV